MDAKQGVEMNYQDFERNLALQNMECGVAHAFIPWKSLKEPLPGLNELIKWSKSHWAVYRKEKRKWEDWCIIHLMKVPKRRFKRVFLEIQYMERAFKIKVVGVDHPRDADNVVAAKKYLFDAMVKAEIIRNDDPRYIAGWMEAFHLAPDRPGIDLTIHEANEEEGWDPWDGQ